MFRAVAARLTYLSQDWPDITFATMKLCSKMSRLNAQDLKNMKRVGQFLFGRPKVGCLFEWQVHPSALHALADADCAGDRQSRKSVSGCMISYGKHLIKAWTKQQSIAATSTAKKQYCTLATVQQQSRWEFRRLPKTWGCTSTPVQFFFYR